MFPSKSSLVRAAVIAGVAVGVGGLVSLTSTSDEHDAISPHSDAWTPLEKAQLSLGLAPPSQTISIADGGYDLEITRDSEGRNIKEVYVRNSDGCPVKMFVATYYPSGVQQSYLAILDLDNNPNCKPEEFFQMKYAPDGGAVEGVRTRDWDHDGNPDEIYLPNPPYNGWVSREQFLKE